MWWLLHILAIVALSLCALFYAGKALFVGNAYPVPTCNTFVWVRGDTTKGRGVNVTSHCSAGIQ